MVILSLCLALIGTVSVSAQNFVPGYFGWVGQETYLSADAVTGSRLHVHFDIYIDPAYWATPFSAEIIFGLGEHSDVLDALQIRSDVALAHPLTPEFRTVLAFDIGQSRLPNQEGLFGSMTLIFEILDVDLLRERLEAAPNNRLNISIRYGQFMDANYPHPFHDDAGYLPAGWTTMADAVNIMDLENQNHTLFVPAAILLTEEVLPPPPPPEEEGYFSSDDFDYFMPPEEDGPGQELIEPQPQPEPGETAEHLMYITGYLDGTFQPDGHITRAEIAAIGSRIHFTQIGQNTPDFPDVSGNDWFANYVGFTQVRGMLQGRPDGSFAPGENMTRAEFVTMITRFVGLAPSGTATSFPDVGDHWATGYINALTTNRPGTITGYEDGTFQPNAPVTRAEAVTIVNRVLNRGVNASGLANVQYGAFTDIGGHWAYFQIIEASNSHEFTVENGNEVWTNAWQSAWWSN